MADILGADTRVTTAGSGQEVHFLDVFIYQIEEGCCGMGDPARIAKHVTFCLKPATGEGNEIARSLTEKWRNAFLCVSKKVDLSFFHDDKESQFTHAPPSRRYLAIVNPHSGSGKAHSIYYNTVLPMILQANDEVDLLETEYQYHAYEEIKSHSELDNYTCLIVIGGDGIISEVIQALHYNNRLDVPLGIVCGGSGNGLSMSILYESHQPYGEVEAAFSILKGEERSMDLQIVQDSDGHEYLSFLCLSYGSISNIDLDSEVCVLLLFGSFLLCHRDV